MTVTVPPHDNKLAIRPRSTTLHIVIGVAGWYNGMTATTECGVRMAAVLDDRAVPERLPATVCKRCVHTLGWDLPPALP
jgi:hypothetical protein